MTVYDSCQPNVVTAPPDAKITDVVKLMDEKNVGCVIITEKQIPVGIITDRDITLRVIGAKKDPKKLEIQSVMTKKPTIIEGKKGLFEAMHQFEGKDFRRMPVVDERGRLVGIITIDDLMRLLARELSFMTMVIETQSPTK